LFGIEGPYVKEIGRGNVNKDISLDLLRWGTQKILLFESLSYLIGSEDKSLIQEEDDKTADYANGKKGKNESLY
jgi:hypothetical protein